jgi:ubiquinone/menaquinone biosynthesis C-methylase UbiE
MFLNPDDTIKSLLVREDWHIADLGAGSGSYTLAAAKYVPMGKIYAIDINREILPFIKAKVLAHGHKNIEVIWGDIDRPRGTNVSDASMDAVILANTFFQIENKNAALQEIERILKPGGKILFIDWAGSFGNLGPREEDVVLPFAAKSAFEKFGFIFKEDVPAGEYHYGMIFYKP